MKYKSQNIFFWITRMVVFLLYVPFLLIYGLFNYPGSFSGTGTHTSFNYEEKNEKSVSLVIKADDANAKAGFKIHLNKRFQPESSPLLCNSYLSELTVYCKNNRSFFTYAPPFRYSSELLTQTLRGPPEIV